MTDKRDPQRGEVWRKGKRTRTVTKICGVNAVRLYGPWVVFQTPTDKRRGHVQAERPEVWHEWAKEAEVIRAAE